MGETVGFLATNRRGEKKDNGNHNQLNQYDSSVGFTLDSIHTRPSASSTSCDWERVLVCMQ